MKRLIIILWVFSSSLFSHAQKLIRCDFAETMRSFPIYDLKNWEGNEYWLKMQWSFMDTGEWMVVNASNAPHHITFDEKQSILRIEQQDSCPTSILIYHIFEGLHIPDGTAVLRGYYKRMGDLRLSCTIEQGDSKVQASADSIGRWELFECTLPYHNADLNHCPSPIVAIKAIATGYKSGFIELKDVELLVDGQPIQAVAPLPPANSDHEFDRSSGILLDSLTDRQVQQLATLCKVWGFLKYHHPSITEGGFDWNYQLFRMMKKTLPTQSQKEFQQDLLSFIPPIRHMKTERADTCTDPIVSQIKMRWLEDKSLSITLRKKLKKVQTLQRNGMHYAVGYYGSTIQAAEQLTQFRNEMCYDSIPIADDGYRLLCLFRFWNMMYYFHPYMAQYEERWEEKLPDYIRSFAQARDTARFENACFRLVSELHDSHSSYYGFKGNPFTSKAEEGGAAKKNCLPLETKLLGDSLLVIKYNSLTAHEAGLEPGDYIIRINGQTIKERHEEVKPYMNWANENAYKGEWLFHSFDGDSVCVTVSKEGVEKEVCIPHIRTVWRGQPEVQTAPVHKQLEEDVLYIDLARISTQELKGLLNDSLSRKGIVFDLREYPDEYKQKLSFLSNFLYPEPVNLFYYSYADIKHPGTFRKNPVIPTYGQHNPHYYKGKVAVLVGDYTMSAGEWLATLIGMAPRGCIVGSSTGAVLGPVVNLPLSSSRSTRYTSVGVYDMNGNCTFPKGIKMVHPRNA